MKTLISLFTLLGLFSSLAFAGAAQPSASKDKNAYCLYAGLKHLDGSKMIPVKSENILECVVEDSKAPYWKNLGKVDKATADKGLCLYASRRYLPGSKMIPIQSLSECVVDKTASGKLKIFWKNS